MTLPPLSSLGLPKVLGDYEIGPEIGSGSSSYVCKSYRKTIEAQCCVKIIPKMIVQDDSDQKHLASEISVLKRMNHQNIVTFYDILETKSSYLVFMEYCPGKTLLSIINDRNGLPESEAIKIFGQIISAISYLHGNKVAHRDLKPENILIDDENNVKVIDFGLSSMDSGKAALLSTYCGSLHYASPEVITRQPYVGSYSDMWSLGVVLYAIVTGQLPWMQQNLAQVMRAITHADFSIPLSTPPKCANLISSLLVVKPEARLTAEEVLHHPWLNQGNNQKKHIINVQPVKLSSFESCQSAQPRMRRYLSNDMIKVGAQRLPPLSGKPTPLAVPFGPVAIQRKGNFRHRSFTLGWKPNVILPTVSNEQDTLPLHRNSSILAEE